MKLFLLSGIILSGCLSLQAQGAKPVTKASAPAVTPVKSLPQYQVFTFPTYIAFSETSGMKLNRAFRLNMRTGESYLQTWDAKELRHSWTLLRNQDLTPPEPGSKNERYQMYGFSEQVFLLEMDTGKTWALEPMTASTPTGWKSFITN